MIILDIKIHFNYLYSIVIHFAVISLNIGNLKTNFVSFFLFSLKRNEFECNYFYPISIELSCLQYLLFKKNFASRCYNIFNYHRHSASFQFICSQLYLAKNANYTNFTMFIPVIHSEHKKQKLCKKIIMPHNEIKGYREKVYLVFAIYVFLKEIMLI